MKIRTLTKREVNEQPYAVWNAFVDLLAVETYLDLTSQQRPAHLVFWYEHEVQNGGHLQYFENRGAKHLDETIEALGQLGAASQQQILHDAAELWRRRRRPLSQTADRFCETALVGEFAAFDARFHACEFPLQRKLEAHLGEHRPLFVTII